MLGISRERDITAYAYGLLFGGELLNYGRGFDDAAVKDRVISISTFFHVGIYGSCCEILVHFLIYLFLTLVSVKQYQ